MSGATEQAMGQLALKKQVLRLRAQTERAEMGAALSGARQSLAFVPGALPALALSKGMPLALGLLRQGPLLGAVLPLLLTGARRPWLRYPLLGAGAALLVWQAYRSLAGKAKAASAEPAD